MARQLKQLPPDITTLARELAQLRREIRELRASKRAGHTAFNTGGLKLTDDDGNTLAEMAADWDDRGMAAVAVYDTRDAAEYYAALAAGDMCFGVRGVTQTQDEGRVGFSQIDETLFELLISSGNAPENSAAMINMYSATGLTTADSEVTVTADVMNVGGLLNAGNFAYGTINITPSAANVPTSVNVSGFALSGTTFTAQATPVTSVPGTTVLGVGAVNPTSTDVTLWLTRANTTSTGVNWMVIGQ
ncbi:hypothetical protein [Streptomyces sp. ok210]|uniref:hypothetical protein n=1 Tax=Streptomyces sp. ok210 TaxID=1761905 RepID=UPI0008EBE944|nr:hypothetical protein [Streptomyces sp. ok210]SFT31807.1 hypothetical protein SAMN04487982_12423 [Streptomyces sp. ok210]